MIERGDPLFAHKTHLKHVSLVIVRTLIYKKKRITIERGDPLCAHNMNHERSMLNEVDIDYRIPGLPHSVVKQLRTFVFVNW